MDSSLSRNYENLKYNPGFGNHIVTESIPGALPEYQNTPKKCPLDLYAEQLTGSSFTQSRPTNFRNWFYRTLPSVTHQPFKASDPKTFENLNNKFDDDAQFEINPNQLRWKPMKLPSDDQNVNFIQGFLTVGGIGNPSCKEGMCIYQYTCNKSMTKEVFSNADGEMLIVPQKGTLYVATECGLLTVSPTSILVIPRGLRFSIEITEASRGWVCEIFNGRFKIPDLGPIGANGLANPRDFEGPSAWYEDRQEEFTGKIFECTISHSPFNVVAWHGNYYPYRYDLNKFNTMNTVSFDHPDPSIFTVLTAPSHEPGTALIDFVIFPPRWLVAENTFKPPYYHRNTMTEYMGNIYGVYDAKEEGFGPGCSSLHSCMTPHGPEAAVFEKASNAQDTPLKLSNTLSFMFETYLMIKLFKASQNYINVDADYYKCWSGLKKHFKGTDQITEEKTA